MLCTATSIVGTAAMIALSAVWGKRVIGRDDALAECSDQGVRAVWPGPASIR